MRRFFRFVLMAMILIVVGLMSALTAMRVAIHGRETTVPSFVKLSTAEAERTAVTNGLSIVLEGQFYSNDVPEGRIVSQMPPAGSVVRRGWRVRLAQSLGQQRVIIPNVVGESPRAAELNVRQRGLELGTIAEVHLANAPADQIVAQSPPPNAAGVQSPKLDVLTAVAPEPQPFVMPNFIGRPFSEVAAAIQAAGFKIAHVSLPTNAAGNSAPVIPGAKDANASPMLVTHQIPAAGQKVTPDTPITLEVGQPVPPAVTQPAQPAAQASH
jgi:eukaryotic-like serine/threonine-protein kinase